MGGKDMLFKIHRWFIQKIVGKMPVMMNLSIEIKDDCMYVTNEKVVYQNNDVI
jgi:hypothetical protein